MNDTLLVALRDNTTAVMTLTGTLWAFAGMFLTGICGYLVIRYVLRG